MSCQIKTFSYFADVDNVKRYLFPNFVEEEWDWPEEDLNDNAVVNSDKESSWLQECHVSLSPFGDVLAIARKSTLVILMSKWDTQEQGEVKMKFHIVWRGNPCKEEDEQITAVLCLPVIAPGKSSHVAPDWTSIAVGFSSGFVRLYSETVNLLAEELLHDEPVKSIKCQSFHPARGGVVQEQLEEVYVTYNTVICSLPGFGLFQSLRACRNQLARVKANCAEVLKAPPLMYKKWGFQEQEVTTDSEMVGVSTANTFDHLMTASLCGGFGAYYRSSAPQTLLVVGAGKKPFVGFHYALEGGPQPVLTDMAKAVATKLKTAIGQAVPFSGWWSGAKKGDGAERPKDKVAQEAVEPMVCRFGLCDKMRNGDKIIISPNRRLSAVTDSLGRIILIDNHKGIALRMWKGYREAQCSWIEVQEEIRQRSSGLQPRLALFLVIFSPKRGSIEIWAMEQGPKVATFKVSAHGRLLYIGHGFMGLNNTSMKGGNRSQFPCVFIDSSGSLNEIIVPFHFALSDKNSRRARDLHLLKKLKTFLKEVDFEDDRLLEEVQKTMSELKTNEIRLQAIEMLSSNKYSIPEALEVALNECVDKLSVQDPETLDHTGKLLLQTTQNLQKLVSFYQFVRQQHDKPPAYNSVVVTDLKTPQLPGTEDAWEKIADGFERRWNFPNCIGAIDGKHVAIQRPENSGSTYFNYKGHFSIVLMAIVDDNYSFTYCSVGCQGKISDGGVFKNTVFSRKLFNNELHLPPPKQLPDRELCIPDVLLADDASPLSQNIMKPFSLDLEKGSPKRVYNYRLSRARRIVENAFGLMTSVFRVFRKPMELKVENVIDVTLCCVYLHNFLRKQPTSRNIYAPFGSLDTEDASSGEVISGSWRNVTSSDTGLKPVPGIPRKPSSDAKKIRDEFLEYFLTERGSVPWQDKYM